MKRDSFLFLLSIVFLISSCGYQSIEVDMIIHNATIYTVDAAFSQAEAMAIKDGKILDLGAERTILNKYKAAKTIDAAKKFIYPGLIDAHCHFYFYGISQFSCDLSGTTSWDECLDRLKKFAKENPDGWLLGGGWDQNDWKDKSYPTNEALNRLFPDRAVYLDRIDGHAAIANAFALKAASLTPESMVEGGEIVKDKDNQLTGLLIDNGMNAVSNIVPEPSIKKMENALQKAQADCFAEGLTTVDDAGLDMEIVSIIREMQEKEELKIRVYAMLNPSALSLVQLKKGKIETDRLTVRSVKLYGDGSLGSRGACLKKAYTDRSDHHGAMIEDISFYRQWAQNCKTYEYQLNTHCIGDSANSELLQTYADHIEGSDLRWRIEHAQIVSPNDRHFFGENGIIPSVQPTHATSDMYWVEDRIGKERMKGAYAYKSLLQENGMLALGTDFPVEKISPINTFYAAVARKDHKNFPENGFLADQALSRKEALMGMTIWAAMANFENEVKGSLEIGKYADFVILDRDILNVSEGKILGTKVKSTYVGGDKVYGN